MRLKVRCKLERKDLQSEFMVIFPAGMRRQMLQIFSMVSKKQVDLECVIKRADMKTNEQLRYYYAEVLPKAFIAYRLLGWDIHSEEQADDLLKEHSGFLTKYVNTKTGEVKHILKSKAKMKIDEMTHLIEIAIRDVCGSAGVEVSEPVN